MTDGQNKFLTEVMGLNWYTKEDENPNWPAQFQAKNIHFSTWTGFGNLWEWSQKQDWWGAFYASLHYNTITGFNGINYEYEKRLEEYYVNPERFANAVYEFLKEK